jgi:hypothetical protein
MPLFLQCLGTEMLSITLGLTHVDGRPKSETAHYAEAMVQILAAHESTRFHFRSTCEESSLFYSYHERTRCVASCDHVRLLSACPTIARRQYDLCSSMEQAKSLSIFCPESMKMDTDDFRNNIIDEMARLCYSQGRRPRERKIVLHFNNEPIHCTGTIRDRMAGAQVERT